MNKKNVSRVIGKKIALWIESLPAHMRDAVRRDTIVTGGAIPSLLLGEEVRDFDVYFRTKDTAMMVANFYVAAFKQRKKQRGVDIPIHVKDKGDRVYIYIKSAGTVGVASTDTEYAYFEGDPDDERAEDYAEAATSAAKEEEKKDRKPFQPVWMSCNAISLTDKIQVVTRFFGNPDEIHGNYDFVHCMNYWCCTPDMDGGLNQRQPKLVLRQEALESLLAMELTYRGSLYPVCSLFRIRKFIERGWTINAGQILKIAFQISELDLHDLRVLEDQLVGVDAAYFFEVLRILKQEVAKGKTLDQTYLAALVDKVF